MKIKYWYFLSVGIILIDQLMKILTNGVHFNVIPGVLSFNSVQNTGAGFSILMGALWLFIILSILFVVGMILFDLLYKKDLHFNPWYKIGFTLMLGGIIGNFIDRVSLGFVRDFIAVDFMNFPIFNIADIALCIGTGCIVVWLLFFCRENVGNKQSTVGEALDYTSDEKRNDTENNKKESNSDNESINSKAETTKKAKD